MSKQHYLVVPGTWAAIRNGGIDYWEPGGALNRMLEARGWVNAATGVPFWDTRGQGTIFGRLLFRGRYQQAWHIGWRLGGMFLSRELQCLRHRGIDPEDLVGLGHSHALQVWAYALSDPACPRIKALLSVASPTRNDMELLYTELALKVDRWLHLQMGGRDRWKWLGTIGTGSWADTIGSITGLTRGPAQATRRDRLVDYDHSEFINVDPTTEAADLWPSRLDYLEDGDIAYA